MKDNDIINPLDTFRYAGIFRRLFSIIYDSFLLIAIIFIITGIATALNGGKAIEPDDTFYPLYVAIVFISNYLYFAWFWTHGGQTLGMKTWRIKLIPTDGETISWKTATIRYLAAIISWGLFTLGFLWSIIDSHNQGWHDLASRTALRDLRY